MGAEAGTLLRANQVHNKTCALLNSDNKISSQVPPLINSEGPRRHCVERDSEALYQLNKKYYHA